MATEQQSSFKLIENDGWSENEIYRAESLEEIKQHLDLKCGDRDV